MRKWFSADTESIAIAAVAMSSVCGSGAGAAFPLPGHDLAACAYRRHWPNPRRLEEGTDAADGILCWGGGACSASACLERENTEIPSPPGTNTGSTLPLKSL